MTTPPPTDLEAEEAVLGSVVIAPQAIRQLIAEEGLRPEHFYRDVHRQAFSAMVAISDRGEAVDSITLTAEMGEDHRPFADAIAGAPPYAGNFREYARRVVALHERRRLITAGHMLAAAGHTDDRELRAQAEAMLIRSEHTAGLISTEQLAERAYQRMEGEPVKRWALPWAGLNPLLSGGIEPGAYVLVGGWTSHGKTAALLQMLDHFAEQGAKVNLYVNEDSVDMLVDRLLARRADVSFGRLLAGNLNPAEKASWLEALPRLPFPITPAADWSAPEIARHMRWNDFDVVGLDILHNMPFKDEHDLHEMSTVLSQAARASDTALVCTVHLNDARCTGPQRPEPVKRDIRNSGMLQRQARHILFVWQQDDLDGLPTGEGLIKIAKASNGQTGGVPATFKGSRMLWKQDIRLGAVA